MGGVVFVLYLLKIFQSNDSFERMPGSQQPRCWQNDTHPALRNAVTTAAKADAKNVGQRRSPFEMGAPAKGPSRGVRLVGPVSSRPSRWALPVGPFPMVGGLPLRIGHQDCVINGSESGWWGLNGGCRSLFCDGVMR